MSGSQEPFDLGGHELDDIDDEEGGNFFKGLVIALIVTLVLIGAGYILWRLA